MPFKYNAGIGAVGSYQVSGKPWITGSVNGLVLGTEHKISFPTVAKAVTVINTDVDDGDLHVHFNSKTNTEVSGGLHYVALNELNTSMTFAVKCKEIYISSPAWGQDNGSYTVLAELTGIDTIEMYDLTGSGLTNNEGKGIE